MEKLFNEFNPVTNEDWLEKIQADLKGKSEDLLKYEVEQGINVNSFHHQADHPQGSFSNDKSANKFNNRKKYSTESNQEILNDLNEGVDHLGLYFSGQPEFNKQAAGIEFDHIKSDIKFNSASDAQSFVGNDQISLNFDILSAGVCEGIWKFSKEDFITFYKTQSAHKNIWISGSIFGQAGSSAVQELAFSANLLNEYLELLSEAGQSLSNIGSQIVIELSVTEDYFLNIAKFKVARQLFASVLKAHGTDISLPLDILATTSTRKLARNDANNNLLRQTTQAMSAIVGGCDSITITPEGSANETHHRMAKNIPLVLKEESYFDKVGDPSEGSYYVEEICSQVMDKAWELFKEVESFGGFCSAVESNFIQNKISENRDYLLAQMNSGEKTFLGVNKFPPSHEEWKTTQEIEAPEQGNFEALRPFSLESHFKKELHGQS